MFLFQAGGPTKQEHPFYFLSEICKLRVFPSPGQTKDIGKDFPEKNQAGLTFETSQDTFTQDASKHHPLTLFLQKMGESMSDLKNLTR